MKLNRPLQRRILEALADEYPDHVRTQPLQRDAREDELFANLHYLYEHGLIFTGRYPHPLPDEPAFVSVKITAASLDFLQDDGGISAMLNTVTVRFDAEEIRAVFAEKVAVSDLPKPERDRLTHAVRSLPAEA